MSTISKSISLDRRSEKLPTAMGRVDLGGNMWFLIRKAHCSIVIKYQKWADFLIVMSILLDQVIYKFSAKKLACRYG